MQEIWISLSAQHKAIGRFSECGDMIDFMSRKDPSSCCVKDRLREPPTGRLLEEPQVRERGGLHQGEQRGWTEVEGLMFCSYQQQFLGLRKLRMCELWEK